MYIIEQHVNVKKGKEKKKQEIINDKIQYNFSEYQIFFNFFNFCDELFFCVKLFWLVNQRPYG